jgi:hypothetical protein
MQRVLRMATECCSLLSDLAAARYLAIMNEIEREHKRTRWNVTRDDGLVGSKSRLFFIALVSRLSSARLANPGDRI